MKTIVGFVKQDISAGRKIFWHNFFVWLTNCMLLCGNFITKVFLKKSCTDRKLAVKTNEFLGRKMKSAMP